MRESAFVLTLASGLALVSGVLLAPASGLAQTAAANSAVTSGRSAAVLAVEKKAESLAPKGWKVPRTPDGQPDLQGYYTNVSLTPMSRSKALGDQLFYTPEEAAKIGRSSDPNCLLNCRSEDTRSGDASTDLSRAYNDVFFDRGNKIAPTLQTSTIVDPPDGRMPAYTPTALKEMRQERATMKEKCADPTRVCPAGYDGKTPSLADKPSDMSLMTRCIKWQTVGPPMLPAVYDSNYHIIQSKNYVMIQVEGGREVRMIPLDGRPHLPPSIRLWNGDSRGHWEGNTLVVDTTNFNSQGGNQESEKTLHVIERFTRVAPSILLYEFTVDNPATYVRPYTGIIPMTAIKGPIYEYACNEGNIGLGDILKGARLEEKKRAEKAGTEVPAKVTGAESRQ